MTNYKTLRALCDAATDGADLGETIGFIDMFLPLKRGFQVSDHDHAEMIMKWLCELSQYRQSVPALIDEVERVTKQRNILRKWMIKQECYGASVDTDKLEQALKGTDNA